MAGKPRSIDASIELARLSLAGTQNKCGLFHDPKAPLGDGWYQPVGGAPSNYIIKFAREDLHDLMIVEHLSSPALLHVGFHQPRQHCSTPHVRSFA